MKVEERLVHQEKVTLQLENQQLETDKTLNSQQYIQDQRNNTHY